MHDGVCAGGDALTDPVRVERMEVRRGHLVCRVAFGAAPRVTSPQLMSRVLAVVPTLAQHACVNERGTTFAAVMDCTPLPHLLEHLVVDLQVRNRGSGSRCPVPLRKLRRPWRAQRTIAPSWAPANGWTRRRASPA